jgi:hypothetical protein
MSRNWLAMSDAPLFELLPGDRVVRCSPLRRFAAIGTVIAASSPSLVAWHEAREVPIDAIEDQLTLGRNALGAGLIEITSHDMATIAEAMFTDEARPGRPGDGRSRGSAGRTSGSQDLSLARAA